MKILIISNDINPIKNGCDFLPISRVIYSHPNIDPKEIFFAKSCQSGIKIAQEQCFGIKDLIFIEVFLPKEDSLPSSRCGEDCAAGLINNHVNVFLVNGNKKKLDNVVNNIGGIFEKKYHMYTHNLRPEPRFVYLRKSYGAEPGDRSDFETYLKLVLEDIIRSS